MPKHTAVAAIEEWCALHRNRFALEQIYRAVNQEFDLEPKEMKKGSRRGQLVEARRCFVWYSRRLTSLSLMLIGDSLHRDHTSIINLNEKATGMLEVGDQKLSEHIINIYDILKTVSYEEIFNQTKV